jgi:hypothetical protein
MNTVSHSVPTRADPSFGLVDVDPDWSTNVDPCGREQGPILEAGSCSTAQLVQFLEAVFRPSGGIK